MMKYSIGDRVRIVSEAPISPWWNDSGKMDKWLGQVMTIRDEDDGVYKMVEDEFDTNCNFLPGWDWYENMIEGLANEEPEEPLPEFKDTKEDKALNKFISSYRVE